jgi:DNA-binding Xre family transcriptional regulator
VAQVKTRILELMAKKQIEEKRLITAMVLVEETGLAKPTVYKWINDDVTRFDDTSLVALCRYFQCEIADLLYIAWDEDADE